MPSLYVVNPTTYAGGYHTSQAFVGSGRGWVQIADLVTATVAAFAPDHWNVRITDENVDPVDLDWKPDFVAITGKYTQRDRMLELASEFKRRGSTVMIGGAFASLSPDQFEGLADILVTGEIEELGPVLFADLEAGVWKSRYDGGRADMSLSRMPRWDLYPVENALVGAIQTTRGCPFNCEFCDVIQYQGRKQRHKPIELVMAELEDLYARGFRQVFIVDDNFTVHRQWVNTVLDALIAFNAARPTDAVRFLTQASLDLAREDALLEKCRRAGVTTLFMGIETVNSDSLREAGKKQNLLLPVQEAVKKIVRAGIAIQAGIIVGFDHDGPEIFETMLEFFQDSPLPDLAIGPLIAPRATDVSRRLAAAGRLDGETWDDGDGGAFWTNIIPARMSRTELIDGVSKLVDDAYSPHHFERRMMNLIELYGDEVYLAPQKPSQSSARAQMFRATLRRTSQRGAAEAQMVSRVVKAAGRKPAVLPTVLQFLVRYENTRSFLDAGRAKRLAAVPCPEDLVLAKSA